MSSTPPERGTRPPDFIGVGTDGPASGWWYDLLLAHPRVRGPRGRPDPPHFFGEFCGRPLEDADIAEYHQRFRRSDGEAAGEWEPRYMSDGWVPPLLRRAAPDTTVLVMLSDPVERARAYAVQRRPAVEEGKRIYLTDVANRLGYASQLARLRRFFPPERILVLQFERCREDALAEYRRTLRFLELDDFVPPGLGGRVSRLRARLRRTPQLPASGAPPLRPDLEDALRRWLKPDVDELAASVPGFELGLWPGFAR